MLVALDVVVVVGYVQFDVTRVVAGVVVAVAGTLAFGMSAVVDMQLLAAVAVAAAVADAGVDAGVDVEVDADAVLLVVGAVAFRVVAVVDVLVAVASMAQL